MRLVLLLVGFAASSLSCSSFFQCQPGQCPTGESCVVGPGTTVPKCLLACQFGDAGSICPAGSTCTCTGTDPGSENCFSVCAQ